MTPSTLNCTFAMPLASEAVALNVTTPVAVGIAGSDTAGGVLSTAKLTAADGAETLPSLSIATAVSAPVPSATAVVFHIRVQGQFPFVAGTGDPMLLPL